MFTLKAHLPIIVFFILSVSPNLITTRTLHSRLQAACSTCQGAPYRDVLKKMRGIKKPSGQGMREGFLAWISSRESRLLETPTDATKFDLVVTKDGSGNFTSIKDVVAAARNNSKTSVQSAKDIVRDTCKTLADSDPDYNFGFCTKSLESNPESHKANLKRRGLIGLQLLQANLTDTTKYIKQLLKQKLELRELKALLLCLHAYSLSEGVDMTPTHEEKHYFNVNIWVY